MMISRRQGVSVRVWIRATLLAETGGTRVSQANDVVYGVGKVNNPMIEQNEENQPSCAPRCQLDVAAASSRVTQLCCAALCSLQLSPLNICLSIPPSTPIRLTPSSLPMIVALV
jgi:hypothetical protein